MPGESLLRRAIPVLAVVCLMLLAVAPAEGVSKRIASCGVSAYSYAGVESQSTAHGVAALLTVSRAPSVTNGHVGGWIGLGGPSDGPGGTAEWLQTGYAAFGDGGTSQMYYEVTVAGQSPKYVQLSANVRAGEKHRFAVLEMSKRKSWWRVWVDGSPVSKPIHLPKSDGTWYPEAVAENWNGNAGACNTYSYRFADVSLATAKGGSWRPLGHTYTLQDPGYRVVPLSSAPRAFLATSLL
jgi:hypothetical protein